MVETTKEEEFAKPPGLSELGEKAYRIFEAWRKKHGFDYTGGCKTYYSPQEWKDRREEYGCSSELLIVHDGGDLSSYNDMHPGGLWAAEDLGDALAAENLYLECCTCWFHAVYKM